MLNQTVNGLENSTHHSPECHTDTRTRLYHLYSQSVFRGHLSLRTKPLKLCQVLQVSQLRMCLVIIVPSHQPQASQLRQKRNVLRLLLGLLSLQLARCYAQARNLRQLVHSQHWRLT